MRVMQLVFVLIRGIVADRAELAVENLALRQQLAILEQRSKRPRLRKRDRIFWAILSRIWANWRAALLIVQPDTVRARFSAASSARSRNTPRTTIRTMRIKPMSASRIRLHRHQSVSRAQIKLNHKCLSANEFRVFGRDKPRFHAATRMQHEGKQA